MKVNKDPLTDLVLDALWLLTGQDYNYAFTQIATFFCFAVGAIFLLVYFTN